MRSSYSPGAHPLLIVINVSRTLAIARIAFKSNPKRTMGSRFFSNSLYGR